MQLDAHRQLISLRRCGRAGVPSSEAAPGQRTLSARKHGEATECSDSVSSWQAYFMALVRAPALGDGRNGAATLPETGADATPLPTDVPVANGRPADTASMPMAGRKPFGAAGILGVLRSASFAVESGPYISPAANAETSKGSGVRRPTRARRPERTDSTAFSASPSDVDRQLRPPASTALHPTEDAVKPLHFRLSGRKRLRGGRAPDAAP
ncbi:hypothetical protein CDCA_CDCA14G3856 [Cyanidium caldarium]|uniref:Uncharacterized protein n=1 Tax=Cyanidium caldarium TaxID=2771 RepID=A0AAV9J0B9_CYACA|nr:hypothetical protein CDCA_CDCA14G3856 [Cyanidium caldarium]|eukprot:ctg_2267.g610